MKQCKYCGAVSPLHHHHLICGTANRKACETPYSVILLCPTCHNWVHNADTGREWWLKQKQILQQTYFRQGKTEEEVRQLMGGRLILNMENEIYGLSNRPRGRNYL
jgi:hypothetical protein